MVRGIAGSPLRVAIYNEPAGTGIGGSESMSAVMAEALAADCQADLLHHIANLSAERLGEVCGTDLTNVRLRYVEPDYNSGRYSRNVWRRYEASRSWYAELSRPYDLFVAVTHDTPPFCHAARGVLVALFPFDTAAYLRPPEGVLGASPLHRRVEYAYRKWEWKKRMEGYQLKTAISDYSREWARRRWGIDCEVLHPPVDTDFGGAEKANIILSVGRFALDGEGHLKRQPEMLASFLEMAAEGLQDWEYYCAGGLRDSPGHSAYFDRLRDAGSGRRAHLIANVERPRLKRLYERASIFWHAAGYGEDEETRPEMVEHFGISTVEAMAAGCVPVVINKGGQREIVEHGVSGFLWGTLPELKAYTGLLIRDERLRAKMSEAARARARHFSREAFVGRFTQLLRPLLRARRVA